MAEQPLGKVIFETTIAEYSSTKKSPSTICGSTAGAAIGRKACALSMRRHEASSVQSIGRHHGMVLLGRT